MADNSRIVQKCRIKSEYPSTACKAVALHFVRPRRLKSGEGVNFHGLLSRGSALKARSRCLKCARRIKSPKSFGFKGMAFSATTSLAGSRAAKKHPSFLGSLISVAEFPGLKAGLKCSLLRREGSRGGSVHPINFFIFSK